jgi:multicomponent Na+:H+ antiporter subunit C
VSHLPYLLAAWLFLVGLYGVATSRHFVHLVFSLGVTQSSTYVLLLAIGFRKHATAPVFAEVPVGTRAVDPVVQALVLTDVVVSVTVSALLLALAVDVFKRTGEVDPDALAPMRG